ncbi:MAG: helix-turn-helix domain-containing protein, partial [Pseudomonadales bacterium]
LEGQSEEMQLNLKLVRARAERVAIVQALGRSQNNLSQTARSLGVSRPTLYNLLDKHGLAERSNDDGPVSDL